MAGSAINLTGMLSDMANTVGSQGGSIGKAMFNPMLRMQADEREKEAMLEAEARQQARTIAAEARRKKANDTLRIEQDARNRDKMAAVNPNVKAWRDAEIQGNPTAAKHFADKVGEQSVKFADKDLWKQSQEMGSKTEAIGIKGAVRGIETINKALSEVDDKGNPKLDKRQIDALTARRDTLMGNPKVRETLQAKQQATNAIKMQQASLAASSRTAKNTSESEIRATEGRKGEVEGNAMAGLSTKEIDSHLLGKSAPYIKSFRAQRKLTAERLTTERKLTAQGFIPKDKYDKAYKGVPLTHEQYKAQWDLTPETANSNLRALSKTYQDSKIDKGKVVQEASGDEVDRAKEWLNDSFENIGSWTDSPSIQDINTLALGIANTINHGQFDQVIKDGKLTEEGKAMITKGLQGRGVKIDNPRPTPKYGVGNAFKGKEIVARGYDDTTGSWSYKLSDGTVVGEE